MAVLPKRVTHSVGMEGEDMVVSRPALSSLAATVVAHLARYLFPAVAAIEVGMVEGVADADGHHQVQAFQRIFVNVRQVRIHSTTLPKASNPSVLMEADLPPLRFQAATMVKEVTQFHLHTATLVDMVINVTVHLPWVDFAGLGVIHAPLPGVDSAGRGVIHVPLLRWATLAGMVVIMVFLLWADFTAMEEVIVGCQDMMGYRDMEAVLAGCRR